MSFIKILELAESREVSIIDSDILEDEIEGILNQEKRIEIQMLMTTCEDFVELSDTIPLLGLLPNCREIVIYQVAMRCI